MKNNKLDEYQLKVVNSKSNKLVVEAPAGYGKTYTMINLIDTWINNGFIKNNKRLLCLSFSTSAANKMKESLEILQKDSKKKYLPIKTTNFHGLCRSILQKYGYAVSMNEPLNDYNNSDLKYYNQKNIPDKAIKYINSFDNNIKNCSITEKMLLDDTKQDDNEQYNIEKYNNYIKEYLMPQKILTYNSLITLTLELFQKYPALKHFYTNYFSAICVDEFQDTNILGLTLIHQIKGDSSKFVAFGDSLQTIYTFIGAVPFIIEKEFNTEKEEEYISLQNNYRFSEDSPMYLLDRNLRSFQKDMKNYNKSRKRPKIKTLHGKTNKDEANKIVDFINNNDNNKIAILFSINSKNTEEIINNLSEKNINYFDGLFKEDDEYFDKFKKNVADIFKEHFINKDIIINNTNHKKFINKIKKRFTNKSFTSLLTAFIKNSIKEIDSENRNEHIIDTLQYGNIKGYMNEINENVIINTIHGAKGLEWDYVIIANFENIEFPNYSEMQNIKENKEYINELINKFYVAFTRAKKEFIISYSDYRTTKKNQIQNAFISDITKYNLMDIDEI